MKSRPVSKDSCGSGASSGRSATKYSPIVRGRDRIRRLSSPWAHWSITAFSSARDATSGTGTRRLRRNQPICPALLVGAADSGLTVEGFQTDLPWIREF